MKGLIFAILITNGVSSCIAPPISTGTTNQGTSSLEMEAKRLTTQYPPHQVHISRIRN